MDQPMHVDTGHHWTWAHTVVSHSARICLKDMSGHDGRENFHPLEGHGI